MIRVKLFTKSEVKTGGVELLDEWNPSIASWVWVDIDREMQSSARDLLNTRFNISQLVLDDIHRHRHPPKLEQLPNCWFLMMRGLDANSNDMDFKTIQLAFLVGKNFLITAHEEASVSIDSVWQKADTMTEQVLPMPPQQGAEFFCYKTLRALTDRYQPIVTVLEERLEAIEEAMFIKPDDKLLAELLGYSRQLKKLRRICRYHETHLRRLLLSPSEPTLIHCSHEFTDVYEHQERLATTAQLHLEITNDLVNGYLSLSAHRLNQVMRVLTVVTVIFVPLTFIAGIYGMNFSAEASDWNMPELGFKYGYPLALGFMLTVAIALIVAFRKRGWL